jgi:uncharacterized protein DUF4118
VTENRQDGGAGVPEPASTVPREDARTRVVRLAVRMRPLLLVVVAVVAPVAVAAGVSPFRGNVASATVALGLAVVVSLVAATGTRLTAAITAVSAALSFDFFFTKPYGAFVISGAQDIETTVLLLVGGLIVGQLSARNRMNRRRVAQASAHLSRVQAIAELLASGAPADEVVAAVGDELEGLLRLRRCWFDTAFPSRPTPTIERDGSVTWGHFRWGFNTLGLPGKEITVLVEHRHRRLGRYVLLAHPGAKVTREQLLTTVTLADLAGTALGAAATPAVRVVH